MIETKLSEIEERNAVDERHCWTILHRKSDIHKLVKALRQYKKAYDLMKDAAVIGLDCDCLASERLSGHKTTCKVPHIEFKINIADEQSFEIERILSAEEND